MEVAALQWLKNGNARKWGGNNVTPMERKSEGGEKLPKLDTEADSRK
jgi:hypothetical protein